VSRERFACIVLRVAADDAHEPSGGRYPSGLRLAGVDLCVARFLGTATG